VKPSFRRKLRESLSGYLYVGPAAIVLGLFSIFPVGYAFYVSLHQWGLRRGAFVGFDNYRRAFCDPEFGRSMAATLYYVIGTVPVSVFLGLIVANLLAQRIRGRAFYRTMYFLPYVTSVVAAAAVWILVFYPASSERGLANAVMKWLGLPPQSWVEESQGIVQLIGAHFHLRVPDWAAGPSLALVCVIIFSIWSSFGFDVVVLLAGLTNVPKEIYEAAALDGATGWHRLRHITIPLISPTLFFLMVVSTIRAFRVFGQIYVMASKDPQGSANNVTMFIFHAFYDLKETGYGSAVAMILFGIILLVTLVQMRLIGPRVHY